MNAERGSALLEVLGVGATVMLLLLPILLGSNSLQSGEEAVADTAYGAALAAARTGLPTDAEAWVQRALPGAEVSASRSGDVISVSVTHTVDIDGIGGHQTFSVTATARVSPYVSERQ